MPRGPRHLFYALFPGENADQKSFWAAFSAEDGRQRWRRTADHQRSPALASRPGVRYPRDVFRRDRKSAVLLVPPRRRLGGDDFLHRLAFFLQLRDRIADSSEHVAVLSEFRAASDRPVAG